MPFHFHLSWSAPPLAAQTRCAWIFQDINLAMVSATFVYSLFQMPSLGIEIESPYSYNFVSAFYSVHYMAFIAFHIRWRIVRNLGAMPLPVACILVNSPPAVLIIVHPVTYLGMYFGDLHVATCICWVFTVLFVAFLYWCLSIHSALPLAVRHATVPLKGRKPCAIYELLDSWNN